MPEIQKPMPKSTLAEMDIDGEMEAQSRFKLPPSMLQLASVMIVSVWPEPLVSTPRPRGGHGHFIYEIGAGSLEKPAYMRVGSSYDLIFSQTTPMGMPPEYTNGMIPAAVEAEALIRLWTGDHPANTAGKKGVGVIAGEVATPKELADLQRLQMRFLQFLIDRADANWKSNRPEAIERIGKEHRRAFEILKLDQRQHQWYSNSGLNYNECPYCERSIIARAIACEHCNRDLVKYFLDRDMEPDQAVWPRVHEDYVRMKKQVKKEG